uniref:Glycosyltransferase n=1 Tax=Kalanchoe fedtschenkoi TaxID=63787 RepID=A0A7N1A3I0_KALFE
MGGEILVVPFFGQGHLFPCVELCKHLVARGFKATLMIPSSLVSSVAASVRENPEIEILEIDSGGMEGLLAERFERLSKPVCAVVDNMMSSSKEVVGRFGIRTVSFFTSGACSAAVEHCMWKAGVTEDAIKPGETRTLPGLPPEMAVSYSEIKRNFGPPLNGPPPFGAGPSGGPSDPPMLGAGPPRGPVFGGPLPGFGGGPPGPPPRLGGAPHWIHEVEGSVGLMVNSCDELERPFIGYLSKNLDLPVWGVGPLLPEDYWKSSGALVRDGKFRANRRSNYSEDEVVEWLDSKPKASVLYASFGSEVGPSKEEYEQLALALGESRRPFIWVLQQNAGKHGPPPGLFGGSVNPRESDGGYFPHDLAEKVGKRGLIIRGWAPQLMILSHPSTGGFLSHCGWNSTVEAIGRGVPFLAWPIRGDQFFNAKLVVSLLKTGYMVADEFSRSVEKELIAKGMELVMSDEEMKKRAEAVAAEFGKCFPPSSVAALDAFRDLIRS